MYQIPKIGKPLKIVGGVSRLQTRKIVKNSRIGKNFFVGFNKSGIKVTNKSSFYTTK